MKAVICTRCGANEWETKDGYQICKYCGTRFKMEKKAVVSVRDDVSALLKKCREDPKNAKKYANLILDIYPSNTDAIKYL